MDEIKAMLESLVQGCLKARNEDEKTDKRKLIDEVGGILKDKVDEEVWRTVIGKMEKLAYEKSEADTADNKKAKNEDKEELKEQIRTREVREDDKEEEEEEEKVEDKEAKNEDEEKEDGKCLYKEFKEKVEKEAENKCKKAKNSLDEFKKEFFNGKAEKTTGYISQEAGIELGKKLY